MSDRRHTRSSRGFTLIELIMVIAIMAIIAAAVAMFLRPAVDAYIGSNTRSELADQLDTSVRRMLRDVRRAVPNSIRTPDTACFELVPASTGGRYRMGPDNVNDAASCFPQPTPPTAPAATCSAWVDPSQQTQVFDTLSPMATTPLSGDFVVINNQNGNDVYAKNNVATISSVTPENGSGSTQTPTTQGYARFTLSSSTQVSPGYTGGRFQVISQSEQSVFYICSGADGTYDSQGNGKGTLYRLVRTLTSAYPSACPSTTGAVPVATRVIRCNFVYSANQGATQQSGFVWLELELMRNYETAHLAVGAHVWNVP